MQFIQQAQPSDESLDEKEEKEQVGILPVLPTDLPPDKAFALLAKLFKWVDILELKERYHNKSSGQ